MPLRALPPPWRRLPAIIRYVMIAATSLSYPRLKKSRLAAHPSCPSAAAGVGAPLAGS